MHLRRLAPLLTAIVLIALVATACIVRTGPPRRGGTVYRTAPGERHEKQWKQKKAKKHRKHR